MSIKAELALKSALLSTSLVQPVDSKSKGRVLEILCRQMPGAEKYWLSLIRDMLEAAQTNAFDLHICRRYVLKDNELAFGWNIGLEASSSVKLQASVDALTKILSQAKPILTQVPSEARFHNLVPPPRPKFVGAKPKAAKDRLLPSPRPPGEPGFTEAPPPGFVPQITTIKESIDPESGKPVIIREMPLPHIYRDLNRPAHKDGKGARLIGEKR
jgi:hypothetical protein